MNRFELWSRRKRGLSNERHSVEDAPLSEASDQQSELREPSSHDEPAEQRQRLESEDAPHSAPPPEGSLDHTLPDPDTLGPGSDFKAYLVPGVSSALKNRALRRLWATGNYNVRDGLDDYDLDYSQMRKMTAETSESVRQWGKKLLDKLEEPIAETPSEAVESDPATATGEQGDRQPEAPTEEAPQTKR